MDRRPATPEEARALANPLRLRILRVCLDEALTNKEIAARLGRDPGTTLHHVRKLVATGFLAAEAERRGARGAVERPYRATGKSWTLDVGDVPGGTLALVDAFRAEVAGLARGDLLTLARLGVRLTPAVREELEQRLAGLVDEIHRANDPAGEPYGFFLGLHRRRDETPAGQTSVSSPSPAAAEDPARRPAHGRRGSPGRRA